MNGILLASNDMVLLLEIKSFLLKNIEMKNLREASFVIGIQFNVTGHVKY